MMLTMPNAIRCNLCNELLSMHSILKFINGRREEIKTGNKAELVSHREGRYQDWLVRRKEGGKLQYPEQVQNVNSTCELVGD